MKRKVLILVLGFLLIGANLYAGNGDLIVSGNLGVGTSNPNYKLDVAGDINLTGCVRYNGACISVGGGGGISGSGTGNYLPKWTGGSSLGNSLIYDNGSNVGIGTTNAIGTLHVAYPHLKTDTTERETLDLSSNDDSNPFKLSISIIGADSLENRTVNIQTSDHNSGYGGNIVFQLWGGKVGIGKNSPDYKLELSSDSAGKPSTNTWTITSDARLKKDIQPYAKGLSAILQINPVAYKYNGKGGIGHSRNKKKDWITNQEVEVDIVDTDLLSKTNVGVIAQDIQAIVPETVSSHKGKLNADDVVETDILDFNSHALTFILINAVKELNAKIESLNQQIADLKAKVK